MLLMLCMGVFTTSDQGGVPGVWIVKTLPLTDFHPRAGGFRKWGIPPNWLVYYGQSH